MTRYEQGFMNKCAEYGIDGRELLKKASLVDYFTGQGLQDRIDKNINQMADRPWYKGSLPFKGMRYLRNHVGKPLNNAVNSITQKQQPTSQQPPVRQ